MNMKDFYLPLIIPIQSLKSFAMPTIERVFLKKKNPIQQ